MKISLLPKISFEEYISNENIDWICWMMKQLRKQRNLGMDVIYKIQSNHFYFRLNVSINFSSMYKIFNNFLRIAFIIVRFYYVIFKIFVRCYRTSLWRDRSILLRGCSFMETTIILFIIINCHTCPIMRCIYRTVYLSRVGI